MTFQDDLAAFRDEQAEVNSLREQLARVTDERDALREQLANAIDDAIRLRGQVSNLLYQDRQ